MGCLLLVTILSAAWLRMLSVERGQVRTQESTVRVRYLAESGIARAAKQLQSNANYPGETWEPVIDEREKSSTAKVTISVKPIQDKPLLREVAVTAELGAGANKASRSKRQIIQLPAEEPMP